MKKKRSKTEGTSPVSKLGGQFEKVPYLKQRGLRHTEATTLIVNIEQEYFLCLF